MSAPVHSELGLGTVVAAEAALAANPADPAVRLRLAEACEQARDPAGAALALYPLRTPSHDLASRFARACLRAGWLDEATEAIPSPPPAALRLELAAARVLHGEREPAEELLDALERESGARPLGAGDWLDGAITWVQCRRPERGVEWAQRGLKEAAARGEASQVFAAHLILGRCLLAAGRPAEALDALPGAGSGDPDLDYWLGCAEARCPEPARRAAGRERLARLAPQEVAHSAARAFVAGRALLAAGDARRTVELLSKAAAARYQEVLTYEALAKGYGSLGRAAQADWSRGRALGLRGRYAESAAALRRAVDREPRKERLRLDLASALEADGRLREAVEVLERAQTAFPKSLDTRLHLARLLLKLERTEDTIRTLTSAVDLDASRANEPLGNLGTIFFDSQQFDRALPVLEQAVRAEDADAHSHFYLGRTYSRRMEDPEHAARAVDHLLRASLLDPEYPLPWIAAGAALQRTGSPAEAAACLRRAISGEPESDGPYLALAQILNLQGRLAERALVLKRYAATRGGDAARAALEQEAQGDQKNAEKRYRLGDLLLRRGKPHLALPELLVAASLRHDWKEAHSRLADACALIGYDDLREEAERAAR